MSDDPHTPGIPRSSLDEVIAVYKKGVDRTLIRENLRKTPEQRLRDLERAANEIEQLRTAMAKNRERER